MEMLKSEVKLLLLRNAQLENENTKLTQNELLIKRQLFNERQLSKVLEMVKAAQNDYIGKLNTLLVELTHDGQSGGTGGQSTGFSYSQIRADINNCVNVCKRLQTEYEWCKRTASTAATPAAAVASTPRKARPSTATNGSAVAANGSDNSKRLVDTMSATTSAVNKPLELAQTSSASHSAADGNGSSNEDIPVTSDDTDDEALMYEDEDSQEMPELDLIDLDMDDEMMINTDGEEEDDRDPNGAGEDYLDVTDTEFIPTRTLPKGARKTFPNGGNGAPRLMMSSPMKRIRKSDKRGFKTSQKFGDKFRCNWKDCVFISSYKQNVERHYRVHTGERPFKCQFNKCTFSASQAGNLKVHQQRHGHFTPNAHKIRIKSTHNAVRASPAKSPVKRDNQ